MDAGDDKHERAHGKDAYHEWNPTPDSVQHKESEDYTPHTLTRPKNPVTNLAALPAPTELKTCVA